MWPRIFTSSKYQAAWVVTALASVSLGFAVTDGSADRMSKQSAIERYLLAVAAAWGVSTAGTAVEDFARRMGASQSTPTEPSEASPAADQRQAALVDGRQAKPDA